MNHVHKKDPLKDILLDNPVSNVRKFKTVDVNR